jgi:hypothetical protein
MMWVMWRHLFYIFELVEGNYRGRLNMMENIFVFCNMVSWTAVDSFIGIGSFCGIRSKTLNLRRIFLLWLEICFYNLFGLGVHRLYGLEVKRWEM